MLFFSLWPDGGGFASIDAGLAALRAEQATRDELRSVVDIVVRCRPARNCRPDRTCGRRPAQGPRSVPTRGDPRRARLRHLQRTRTACARASGTHAEKNVDAFLITLKKSEADYSPTTMYRDYPISPTLFHWESQSTTSLASETGQRYVSGSSTVLLLPERRRRTSSGRRAYLFLGPGRHVSHEGERPIAITWGLHAPCRPTSSRRPRRSGRAEQIELVNVELPLRVVNALVNDGNADRLHQTLDR